MQVGPSLPFGQEGNNGRNQFGSWLYFGLPMVAGLPDPVVGLAAFSLALSTLWLPECLVVNRLLLAMFYHE